MCCPNVSSSFITFSIITYVSIFILTLLNMIFSIVDPKYFETFKNIKITDYNQEISVSFLMSLNFGENLVNEDDNSYGYGLTDSKKTICFDGRCDSVSNVNCSNACFNNLDTCFSGQKKCSKMSCTTFYTSTRICKEYKNKINKWKNLGVSKIIKEFKFKPIQHIISSGNCPTNYKICGKINDDDYLCLKPNNEYGCPINKIVMGSSPPKDFNYKSVKFGSQYIYYTNENTKGNIIQNLGTISYENAGPSEIPGKIDSDKFLNLLKYNPYTFSGKFTLKYLSGYKKPNDNWYSYLISSNYKIAKTLEEIKELQKKYEERNLMYNEKSIKNMNEKVKSFKYVLMGFGIASFASFACIAIFFIPIYSAEDCGRGCSKSCDCGLCQNITSMKRVMLFYLICSPTVIFSIFGFFVTLSKKSTYNKYLSMEYIDEYKNMSKRLDSSSYDKSYDHFGKSVTFNNGQFVVLLIILIFLIFYPILVWITAPKDEATPSFEDIEKVALSPEKNQKINNNKKKKKNKDEAYNSTELSGSSSYNSNNEGYNSHPQPVYIPPPQPTYIPPAQPTYIPPQPNYQAQPMYAPPQQRMNIGAELNFQLPRLDINIDLNKKFKI